MTSASTICGVDPGAGGAFALLSERGELLFVRDMPVVEVNGKRRVSAAGVADIICEWKPRLVIIEQVFGIPGEAAGAAFTFGYAAGIIEGVCAGLALPVTLAHPARWKPQMGVSKDKGAARLAAQRMWPAQHRLFARVRDDGRAESALLAAYQVMQWGALAA